MTLGNRVVLAGLALGLTAVSVAPLLQAQGAQRVAYDLTAMYDAVNPSIAKVYSDFGTGSGFLVRQDGLIATNHHVVKNSRYLAVEFPNGRKVTTNVVLLDPKHDLAVLKVNRSVVSGLKPLAILPADRDATVKAGIPAVAFGSPLSQTFLMTQGIVSKVEPDVLLGDFLIQPGNSGGPLLDLEGEVIGINTFAERLTSGAVRINLLREGLANAQLASNLLAEPAAEQLPTPSRTRYPTDLLKNKVLGEDFMVANYRLDGGKFTITARTPVLVAKANVQDDLRQAANRYARRAKKIMDERYDPVDEPFYDWVRNATDYLDPVVTFEIEPNYGQTSGSAWASGLNAVAAGLNGTVAPPTHQTYEFKAEFLDFKLFRDGKLVQPITPGRAITSRSVDSYLFTFVDEAYSGIYSYTPEVFFGGNEWRLEVYDAREPGRVHKSIVVTPTSKLITQIRQDFGGVVSPVAEPTSSVSIPTIGSGTVTSDPTVPSKPPTGLPVGALPTLSAAIPPASLSTIDDKDFRIESKGCFASPTVQDVIVCITDLRPRVIESRERSIGVFTATISTPGGNPISAESATDLTDTYPFAGRDEGVIVIGTKGGATRLYFRFLARHEADAMIVLELGVGAKAADRSCRFTQTHIVQVDPSKDQRLRTVFGIR